VPTINDDVNTALQLLNLALALVHSLRANAGMTADDLIAAADAQDLSNKDQIKALLAQQ
jgi:hypothetical protein